MVANGRSRRRRYGSGCFIVRMRMTYAVVFGDRYKSRYGTAFDVRQIGR